MTEFSVTKVAGSGDATVISEVNGGYSRDFQIIIQAWLIETTTHHGCPYSIGIHFTHSSTATASHRVAQTRTQTWKAYFISCIFGSPRLTLGYWQGDIF